MQNWHDNVLRLIAEIDRCIRAREGETLTLAHLARLLDCSQSQVSHQFHALTGTSLRDFVQARRPALALPAVRDGEQRLLDIALDCGFSSQEAFTRAFRAAYGITPGEYRRSPRPLSLRTVIRPLDCYLAEQAPAGTENDVQTYFITLPSHKFAHIRNYESIGYWDFMQKQSRIPGAVFRNGQRTSAAACPRSRAADGVRERAERPYLQLGHSSGGMLGCASAARLHRCGARSAAADGGPRRGLSGFRARSV